MFSFYQRKKETVSSVSGRSTKECTPVACGDAMLTLSAKLPALMFHVDEDKVSSMVLEVKVSWLAVWMYTICVLEDKVSWLAVWMYTICVLEVKVSWLALWMYTKCTALQVFFTCSPVLILLQQIYSHVHVLWTLDLVNRFQFT